MLPFARLLAALPLTVVMGMTPASAVAQPSSHPHHHGGGVIVWTHRAAEGSEHLMIADADGRHPRQLTTPRPDTSDIDAQVSPDGRWIVFTRHQNDPSTLHLVRPDGTDDHALNIGCTGKCIEASTPTWLSNTRIAYTLVRGPVDERTGFAAAAALYTARIDGTHIRRWSARGIDGKSEENGLHLSADGRYVTLRVGRLSDGQTALFRAAPNGSHRQQLTPWALRADVFDLSTARKGRTKDLVVFESYGRGTSEETFVDIATVPATCRSLHACTAKLRWLTNNAATGRRNANPQWSPNGRNLVFTNRASFSDQNADIFRARYPLAHRRQISTSPAFDYRPAWGVSAGHGKW
jgi:dipeptidyl aminopeptidase/acylaminoacyl peptidase